MSSDLDNNNINHNNNNNSGRFNPLLSSSGKLRSGMLQKKRRSLPQLSITGLKRQSSFTNSSNNTPTSSSSRKSSLQGFDLFGRPHSYDTQPGTHTINDNNSSSTNMQVGENYVS